jgi:hypothetical protein
VLLAAFAPQLARYRAPVVPAPGGPG